MLNRIFLSILTTLLISLLSAGNSAALDTSRPEPDSGPTEVNIRAYLIDIDEIVDAQQSFKANIFIEAKWKDSRLAVGNKTVKYKLSEVWHPNLQIINRQKAFLTFPEIVEVSPEGIVIYRQRMVGDFSQPLDLREFPMDSQTLEIQIVSVGHTPQQVKLVKGPTNISDRFSVPNWMVTGWEMENVDYSFLPDIPKVEGLVFKITVKRYINYYVFKFVTPLLLILFMSWIVFWIDPKDYSVQISVSVTSMLTLIAYQFLVGNSLPQVTYLTRLDKLMFFSTVLVFISLIEVTATSYLVKKDKLELARKFDNYCRYIFPSTFILIAILQIRF